MGRAVLMERPVRLNRAIAPALGLGLARRLLHLLQIAHRGISGRYRRASTASREGSVEGRSARRERVHAVSAC